MFAPLLSRVGCVALLTMSLDAITLQQHEFTRHDEVMLRGSYGLSRYQDMGHGWACVSTHACPLLGRAPYLGRTWYFRMVSTTFFWDSS